MRLCLAILLAIGIALGLPLVTPPDRLSAFAQSQPQPQLPMEKLSIVTSAGTYEFDVEIADDSQEQAMGLMFRETMDPRHGMLFDFGKARPVTMWMRNTILSLDMVFIRDDGSVARVAERTTPYSESIVASGEPVRFVLELNAGIARLIGLKAGDRVKGPRFGG